MDVAVIDRPEAAVAALDPLRARILGALKSVIDYFNQQLRA